jgi:hypothetical protein
MKGLNMVKETGVIEVRYPHYVEARAKKGRLSRKLVSGVAPARLRVVDAADAPVAYVVERDFCPRTPVFERTFRGFLADRVRQTFVYRTVENRLVRSMLEADDKTPLTVDALAGAGTRFWRDHPASKIDGEFPRRLVDDLAPKDPFPCDVRDREAAAFVEVAEDGGPVAFLRLSRVLEGACVVDGVLYRQAPPPAWVYELYPSPALSAGVVDYDDVRFQDAEARGFDERERWVRPLALHLDPRLDGEAVLAAFSLSRAKPGLANADKSTIRASEDAPFPEGHFDRENLRYIGAVVGVEPMRKILATDQSMQAFLAAQSAGLRGEAPVGDSLADCLAQMAAIRSAGVKALTVETAPAATESGDSQALRNALLLAHGLAEVAGLEVALRARLDGVGALAP